MAEFVVHGSGRSTHVEAKEYKIEEGGVVTFYESPEGNKIGDLSERRIRSFKNWDEVKRL